jgi:hypothetical protein
MFTEEGSSLLANNLTLMTAPIHDFGTPQSVFTSVTQNEMSNELKAK